MTLGTCSVLRVVSSAFAAILGSAIHLNWQCRNSAAGHGAVDHGSGHLEVAMGAADQWAGHLDWQCRNSAAGHGAVDEHCCARACTTQSMSTFMAQAPRTVAHLLAQTLLHACTAGCALPAPLSVYTCPHPCHCHHHHCRHRCYIVAIIAIVTAVMTTCAPAHRPPPGGGKGGGGGGGNEEEEEEGTGRKG